MINFEDKIGSKYTPKRTKLYHFKNIYRGSMPPNPPSKAHGFNCHAQLKRHANFQIVKKFLAPPPKSWLRPCYIINNIIICKINF